jgi:hypothetical protein
MDAARERSLAAWHTMIDVGNRSEVHGLDHSREGAL